MLVFKKLLSLRVFQSFYDQFTSKGLRLIPDRTTMSLLNSYGMTFKTTPDGAVVLFKDTSERLLVGLKRSLTLHIFITVEDRFFRSYTDLDQPLGDALYSFNASSSGSKDGEPLLLHKGAAVSSADCFRLLSPNLQSKRLGESVSIFQSGTLVYEGEPVESEVVGDYLADDYGSYTLVTEGGEEEVCYFPKMSAEVLGLVSFSFGGEGTRFEAFVGAEYQLRFSAREVYWRYYFLSERMETIEGVQVKDESGRYTFSEAESVSLINGRQALRITSMDRIPLAKKYIGDKLFATIRNSSSEYPGKRIRLPKPDTKRIKGINQEDQQVYFSEMYVYL